MTLKGVQMMKYEGVRPFDSRGSSSSRFGVFAETPPIATSISISRLEPPSSSGGKPLDERVFSLRSYSERYISKSRPAAWDVVLSGLAGAFLPITGYVGTSRWLGGTKNNRGESLGRSWMEAKSNQLALRPKRRRFDSQTVPIATPLLSFKLADQEELISVIPAFLGLTSGRTGCTSSIPRAYRRTCSTRLLLGLQTHGSTANVYDTRATIVKMTPKSASVRPTNSKALHQVWSHPLVPLR